MKWLKKYLTIIDWYIMRQFITTFLFILGMVIAISIVVDIVEKLDEFLSKNPSLYEIIFVYYLNFVPFWGSSLAPICIYLAVIFFTSRMAQRTEIVPLLSSGVSYYRLLVPYIMAACLLAGVSFYLKAYLVPQSTARQLDFEYKYEMRSKRISSTKDIHKKVALDTYVYISYYNEKRKEGHNFSLERIEDGEIVTKINARKIIWVDSTENWLLEKVRTRHIDGEDESLSITNRLDTMFLLTPDDIFIREQKAESMTLPVLLEYTKLEEMRGSDILKELYIERHRRFADPLAIIILTLIGFAMSSRKSRGGIALQIGLGLLICFIFIALLFAGQAIVGDSLPPWLGVWLPNFVFFPISLFLLHIAPK